MLTFFRPQLGDFFCRATTSFNGRKMHIRTLALSLTALVALSACEREQPEQKARWTDAVAPANAPAPARWYTSEQVASGALLYAQNCASCHKPNAEGTADWMKRGANGNLPPPPLNGTAHTWHHPLSILRTIVSRGGEPVGGNMPAFGDKLSPQEIDANLAWVQSHWYDRIYALWHERDVAVREGMQAKR
jgi:mono/diheme cytochrome c family protein